jgi:GDPmannose 4,6-dehydratase
MGKSALITGITGQDGAYLTEFLLSKGYNVYGTFRRASSTNYWRIEELGIKNHNNLNLLEYELTDLSTSIRILEKCNPDEVYNLAAQSFVNVSFDQPIATTQITGLGALHLLEAIRIVNPKIKFYQASTSEMFGHVREIPQNETTPIYPRSPYGVAKVYAHWMTINYRESYGIFATNGILFNHESPLRGLEFVTRKITDGISRIKLGKQDFLELGNIDAKRDWGFAKDYVEGMYLMLQSDFPDSYVLATGRTESVRHFVEICCKIVDINIAWKGTGFDEIGLDTESGKEIIKINQKFYRPAEVDILIGDSTKAKNELGWQAKTSLEDLCKKMIEADMKRVKTGISF